jgi:hypothetical protein
MELVPNPDWTVRERRIVPAPRGSTRYVVVEGASPSAPRAVVLHDSFFLPPEHRGVGQVRTDIYHPKNSPFRMTPLLGELFSHSVFSWQHEFDASLIERERPGVVIQEQVERMLTEGPKGSAPLDF